jgi:hypothetical protein
LKKGGEEGFYKTMGILFETASPFLKEIPGQFIAPRFIPDKIKKAKKDEQMGLF